MARTIIVNPKPERATDDDATALWVILLVAFGVILIALVGFNRNDAGSNGASVTKSIETTTTTTR